MTKQVNETLDQEEAIDLREIVFRYLRVWYYFLFCIIISIFITTLYLKFTKPIFSVSTKLLIRDDDNSQFDHIATKILYKSLEESRDVISEPDALIFMSRYINNISYEISEDKHN